MSFLEVFDLPLGFFLLLRKDSWINAMMQHEYGCELLKVLHRLQQTQADEDAIKLFRETKK